MFWARAAQPLPAAAQRTDALAPAPEGGTTSLLRAEVLGNAVLVEAPLLPQEAEVVVEHPCQCHARKEEGPSHCTSMGGVACALCVIAYYYVHLAPRRSALSGTGRAAARDGLRRK